ncbi:hypothetical protein R6Q57_022457 [Mikania cordata]
MGPIHENKPHVVCVPAPPQGHLNPMLKLAKILHSKGFFVTFVNTEFNNQRLLRSQGSDSLCDFPLFHFETIPNGLPPPENPDVSQDTPSLFKSLYEHGLGPFKSVLAKVSALYSPVTCIVADFCMGFTRLAADELGIPEVLLWTAGPGSLICYDHFPGLIQTGLMPLKDKSYVANGYMYTVVDCIPTMPGIHLKDIPFFVRMLNPGDEFVVEFMHRELERAKTLSGVIFNTFDELERDVLDVLSLKLPFCCGIGPLHLLESNIVNRSLDSVKSNLWKEDPKCLEWLDTKESCSVIYVNFGSITVMTNEQLVEFCWGLAKSNQSFLWIIRPDLVIGDSAVLPPEFLVETSSRGLLASWCSQEQVLNHSSIGGFLTHSGWNSMIESVSSGVPMICWPFFADQQTNCWLSCNKWRIGMEINSNVKSDEVCKMVIELMMNGEIRGNEMRKYAIEWKNKAEKACKPFGSSMVNLENLIQLLQTSSK